MSDRTSPGAARIVKTMRVQHVVTADECTAGFFLQAIAWDTPFVDLNYTADANVEAVAPADPVNYFVNGFSKALDKISCVVGCPPDKAGDVLVLHAHGVHD